MSRNIEAITLNMESELLKKIESFISSGMYVSQSNFVNAAVRSYIQSENERLLVKKEQDITIDVDPETALKLDELCEKAGKDKSTLLDEIIKSYAANIKRTENHIDGMISDAFAYLLIKGEEDLE